MVSITSFYCIYIASTYVIHSHAAAHGTVMYVRMCMHANLTTYTATWLCMCMHIFYTITTVLCAYKHYIYYINHMHYSNKNCKCTNEATYIYIHHCLFYSTALPHPSPLAIDVTGHG